MPREAGLFESAQGNPLRGYLLLKQSGAKRSTDVDHTR